MSLKFELIVPDKEESDKYINVNHKKGRKNLKIDDLQNNYYNKKFGWKPVITKEKIV